MTVPAPDLSSVVRRIGLLFERAYAADADRPSWPEVEELLTVGYARALALEGERADIERQIGTLVRANGAGSANGERTKIVLRALSARHAELDRNVRWLRSLLAELHEFGSDVRR
jgi:hypothetical protein